MTPVVEDARPASKPRTAEPEEPTQVISEEERAEAVRRAEAIDAERASAGKAAPPKPSTPPAAPAPPATPPTASAAADETAVLPRVTGDDAKPRRGRAVVKPAAPEGQPAPEEPTAVLPQVPDPEQTRQLPRSWRVAKPRSDESVQDKVPDWLFRPHDTGAPQPPAPPVERTRQMPVVDPNAPAPQHGGRYDWAEDTPLDDLPSLTDELLGSRDEWSQWDGREAEGEGPNQGRPEDGRGGGTGRA